MSLRIQTNVDAFRAYRNLDNTSQQVSKSMEKLSSGFRINRASDDAAGLAISERLKAQVNGLDQASRNVADGVSLVQTAEGALDQVHAMLQRTRANDGQTIDVTTTDLATAVAPGVFDIDGNGAGAIASIDAAIQNVSTDRAAYGAVQNRLEYTSAQLGIYQENLSDSLSRVRDVDMASELVKFTKNQIVQQAGVAMLAQANTAPQSVLSLLR